MTQKQTELPQTCTNITICPDWDTAVFNSNVYKAESEKNTCCFALVKILMCTSDGHFTIPWGHRIEILKFWNEFQRFESLGWFKIPFTTGHLFRFLKFVDQGVKLDPSSTQTLLEHHSSHLELETFICVLIPFKYPWSKLWKCLAPVVLSGLLSGVQTHSTALIFNH